MTEDYNDKEHRKLEEKIDEVKDEVTDLKIETITRLNSIDSHLNVYNDQLDTHIRASQANSKRLEFVEDHVHTVNGVLKFGAWFIGTAIAFASLVIAYLALK